MRWIFHPRAAAANRIVPSAWPTSCWQYRNARSPYFQASRQRMDDSPTRNEPSGNDAVKAAQTEGSKFARSSRPCAFDAYWYTPGRLWIVSKDGKSTYPSVGWRFPLDGLARRGHVVPANCFQAVSESAYRKKTEMESTESGAGTTLSAT